MEVAETKVRDMSQPELTQLRARELSHTPTDPFSPFASQHQRIILAESDIGRALVPFGRALVQSRASCEVRVGALSFIQSWICSF